MKREKRKVAAPIGSQQSSRINALRGKPAVSAPIDLKGVFLRHVNRAASTFRFALPLILLAACAPTLDRGDCTDRLRDWRDGCAVARDDAVRTAPEALEPPAEEPETGGGIGTPDGGEGETPEEPGKEPPRETDPDGWQDWKDGQNPGNGKEVGNAPHDGERGEDPSGGEKK